MCCEETTVKIELLEVGITGCRNTLEWILSYDIMCTI